MGDVQTGKSLEKGPQLRLFPFVPPRPWPKEARGRDRTTEHFHQEAIAP